MKNTTGHEHYFAVRKKGTDSYLKDAESGLILAFNKKRDLKDFVIDAAQSPDNPWPPAKRWHKIRKAAGIEMLPVRFDPDMMVKVRY